MKTLCELGWFCHFPAVHWLNHTAISISSTPKEMDSHEQNLQNMIRKSKEEGVKVYRRKGTWHRGMPRE